MKRCPRQVSLNKEAFLLLPQRLWIQTYLCSLSQDLCLFRILVKWNPNQRGPGMIHIGSMFCFFPANFFIVHIHRQELSFILG